MKIYVTHSTSFDFQKELYEPIRNSDMNKKHEIALPHEKTDKQFNSKEYMKDCDLILAEVSYPSTGQGIELGWASIYKIPILCFYKLGTKPSGALGVLTDKLTEYTDSIDLVKKIEEQISSIK